MGKATAGILDLDPTLQPTPLKTSIEIRKGRLAIHLRLSHRARAFNQQ